MAGGKGSSLSSLRGLSTAIAVTVVLLVGGLLAASAFHLAWFGHIRSGMAESPAEVAAKSQALDELRARLGHGGLLQNLTLFAETGEPAALADMNADLEAASLALRGYMGRRLTPTESSLATDLERMLATYGRVLGDGQGTPERLAGKAGLTLTIQHAAIADRIARTLHDQALADRARLEQIATRGFLLGVAAVGALALGVGLLLWMVHARVLSPVRTLAASVAGTAKGDWRAPVWGTDRTDEFGDLARAVDGFRRQAAEIPDISIVMEDGRKRFKFDGSAADLFSKLTDRLQDAGEAMTVRGAEIGSLVAEVRRDLVGTVEKVTGTFERVVEANAEGLEKLGRSTEVLTRAAIQVQAFDANGPSGGLDALVLSLRTNADELAETLAVAAREVNFILKAIGNSEGQMRQAAGTAVNAAEDLGTALAGVEDRLKEAAVLMERSGAALSASIDRTDGRMAKAVEAVDAGEKALVAALGEATARLDDVTRTAADRLDDAAAQMSRSADLLENQAAGLGGQIHDALDDVKEASAIMRVTTDHQTERLEPLAAQMERLHEGLSTIVADVGLRGGEIARLVADFQVLGAEVRAEIDRRSLDPDAGSKAEEMFAQLAATLDQLTTHVQTVDDSARRLSQSLAGSVDDATIRLRDATDEIMAEARAAAAGATDVAATLAKAGAQQEAALATLGEYTGLAADLKTGLGQAAELSDALGAATEAVQALASASDSRGGEEMAELRALILDLKGRVDGMDELAGGLTAAAETVRALMLANDQERDAAITDEQRALAALAGDLKARLESVERLAETLEEAAGTVRALGERESEGQKGLAGIAGTLSTRMDTLDGLSRQLTRAIDALHAAAERDNSTAAASAAASKELGHKLAQVAEQLRATATGLGTG